MTDKKSYTQIRLENRKREWTYMVKLARATEKKCKKHECIRDPETGEIMNVFTATPSKMKRGKNKECWEKWFEKEDVKIAWPDVMLTMIKLKIPITIHSNPDEPELIGFFIGNRGESGHLALHYLYHIMTREETLVAILFAIADSGEWGYAQEYFEKGLRPEHKHLSADSLIGGFFAARDARYKGMGVSRQIGFSEWQFLNSGDDTGTDAAD